MSAHKVSSFRSLERDTVQPRHAPKKSASTGTLLQIDAADLPDLTDMLQLDKKRITGHGSFGTVYSCVCAQNGEVAVKAITLPRSLGQSEQGSLMRKMRRELAIWRRLNHPNIVPLLGTARGADFGSDHPCMVAVWMPNRTLCEYVKKGTRLSSSRRVELIKGTVAGLEYLHSHCLVHGDFHPGNIMIDKDNNARLTDFGFSRALSQEHGQLSYLWTESVRPGARLWAAPELLHPDLYPDSGFEATPKSDIYSLGSIILFVLSGNFPWPSTMEIDADIKKFNSPPRPVFPAIPDVVWDLVEKCWSPRFPSDRPTANEVLSFSRDKLEQLLQPNPMYNINVVLFGSIGCGKSSIINLLADHPIAQVSSNAEPCTRLPQCYKISVGNRRFRFWDTMGFCLADEDDTSPLLPYRQAHAVLQNLADGVDLILLCVRKDGISASLGNLYRLLNDVFYGGRAPIAVVVTLDRHHESWWNHNEEAIAQRTGIPVQSIPHVCITTVQTGRHLSKQLLGALLENHATGVAPISLHFDPSSDPTVSLQLSSSCGLNVPEATALVEHFAKRHPVNVVLFGRAGAGKSSVINLIAGQHMAEVSSGVDTCTQNFRSFNINTGVKEFQCWDTIGFGPAMSWEDYTRSRAAQSANQLIRHLSGDGGIALLVFVKMRGTLVASERDCYRLFEEVICGGQVPVAIVITGLELCDPPESWWEKNGNDLLSQLSGNVKGHACVTSHMSGLPDDPWFSTKLEESRSSVRAMLEDCVSCCNTPVKQRSRA